ncbi:cytochrome P450 [Aquipuribacter sp. SD81]|uniref:cytochrome P450 n=1 Tax=Aquipuribacter sp. SD81 TaxID=3127703 RepID=UPI003016A4D3
MDEQTHASGTTDATSRTPHSDPAARDATARTAPGRALDGGTGTGGEPAPTQQVPRASFRDGVRALATVFLPVAGRGAITRRPGVVGLIERVQGDAAAVRTMQHLRDTYGPGPVQVDLRLRRLVFVLDPGDVHRVLDGTPEPFRADTREKRAALGHFQPEGVLASAPEERTYRRPFNEAVLQSGRTVHEIGGRTRTTVAEEVAVLREQLRHDPELDWDRFVATWWRVVRRVVLGDGARDDEALTDRLLALRRHGNWAYLRPADRTLRNRFLDGVRSRVEAADDGSLAAVARRTPAPDGTEVHQQVPQWLFAFDAAAWATFRALALAATHPEAVERLRGELDDAPDLPYGRSVVLESLRLWPTTPAILRDTDADTVWHGRTLPAGASLMVFAPFFHRDGERLPEAHRFAPALWLRDRGHDEHPLVPFSGGAAICPGRNITLLVASQVLSQLVAEHDLRLLRGPLRPDRPVPATLDPFRLRFAHAPRATA